MLCFFSNRTTVVMFYVQKYELLKVFMKSVHLSSISSGYPSVLHQTFSWLYKIYFKISTQKSDFIFGQTVSINTRKLTSPLTMDTSKKKLMRISEYYIEQDKHSYKHTNKILTTVN